MNFQKNKNLYNVGSFLHENFILHHKIDDSLCCYFCAVDSVGVDIGWVYPEIDSTDIAHSISFGPIEPEVPIDIGSAPGAT